MLISFMHNQLPKFQLSFSHLHLSSGYFQTFDVTKGRMYFLFIFQLYTFIMYRHHQRPLLFHSPFFFWGGGGCFVFSVSKCIFHTLFSLLFLFSICILWVTWSPNVRGQFTEGLQVTSIPKPLEISLYSDNYVISGGIHAVVIGTSQDTKCPQIQGFLSGVM
jgi:cbb3-type cytochrome oxidase subunit 3